MIRTDRKVLPKHFYDFVVAAWPLVADAPLSDAPYIKVICDHLQALYEKKLIFNGKIATKLVINIPPRTGKTIIINILFPVWIWLQKPKEHILTASYAHSLSEEFAQKRRDQVLKSPWFLARWPKLKLLRTQEQKARYSNVLGGQMIATSIGGATTGRGGGVRILDDPHDPEKAVSDAERTSAIRWLRGTWTTRKNQPDAIQILVMQRLHEVDATGFYLKIGGWVHLKIPMQYDPDIAVSTPLFTDTRKPGEALDPKRFPEDILEEDKRTMSPYDVAGQFQQEPAPAEGGHIKRHFLQPYDWEEGHIKVIDKDGLILARFDPFQCVRFATMDVAKTEQEIGPKKQDDPDYSVLAGWVLFFSTQGPYLCLLDLVRIRAEGPELIPMMKQMHEHWDFATIGVETVGLEMISQFARRAGLPIREIARTSAAKKKTKTDTAWLRTEGSKLARVIRATILMGQFRFFRPAYAPWYAEYERELCFFPNTAHDDQVDVTTDACAIAEKFNTNKDFLSDMKALATPETYGTLSRNRDDVTADVLRRSRYATTAPRMKATRPRKL